MEQTFYYLAEDRLNHLLERDNTHVSDVERKSLFYIIAGNEDLYTKVDAIYDFEDHSIRTNFTDLADFCSSSIKLIILGFNLYNGFNEIDCDPLSLLSPLDDSNFELALRAIILRFDRQAFNSSEPSPTDSL